MTYTIFHNLYSSAADCATADDFIEEESGVPDGSVRQVVSALTLIHRLAHGDERTLRAVTGLSQAAFERAYGVPASTLNKWESGLSSPPAWARMALTYAIVCDLAYAD